MKILPVFLALLLSCGSGDLETELGIRKWRPSTGTFEIEVLPGEYRYLDGICEAGTHLLAGRCFYEGSGLVVLKSELDPNSPDPGMAVDCGARNEGSESARIVVVVECAEDQR